MFFQPTDLFELFFSFFVERQMSWRVLDYMSETVWLTQFSLQVRFNVLRVLPRTGKAVKAFSKF
jgi:hypothetical protein